MTRSVLGFRLTKSIPAPEVKKRRGKKNKGAGRPPIYPFAVMEVGESFFAPGVPITRITAAAARYKGKRFVCRSKTSGKSDGVRIWRVQ